MRDINFKTFKKILQKSKLKNIVIDIDSRAVNSEGNQEGAVKGCNPERKGNNCYNILMAFCDELNILLALCVRVIPTQQTVLLK